MSLYTFVVEHNGGTEYEQIEAASVAGARCAVSPVGTCERRHHISTLRASIWILQCP